MKKNTHPEYGKMKVTLSTGETVEIGSVLGAKEGYEMKLDIDSNNHPAYTKSKDQVVLGSSQRNKFEGRFAGMFTATDAKKEEVKAEPKKEAPVEAPTEEVAETPAEEVVAEEAPVEAPAEEVAETPAEENTEETKEEDK